jgi:hypothetical protein
LLFQSANATESDTAGQSQSTRQSYTQPSYGTEFSEENDLTNINEKVKRSDNPNDQM